MNDYVFSGFDQFTKDTVIIVKVKYETKVDENGNEYQEVVNNFRTGFDNSESGRKLLREYLEQPYLGMVMAFWGNHPTMKESE